MDEIICLGLFLVVLICTPMLVVLSNLTKTRKHQDEQHRELLRQFVRLENSLRETRRRTDQLIAQGSGTEEFKGPLEVVDEPSTEDVASGQDIEPSLKSPESQPEPPQKRPAVETKDMLAFLRGTSEPSPVGPQTETSAPAGTADRPRRPTVPEAPAGRVPSQFEQAAKDVLGRIWNWIVVGEEHRPQNVSMEFAIASQWLLRLGIVLLVVGVGFFLKYSIEHDMIGEKARVALATAAGLGLLFAGTRILRGAYDILGQGLMGGGIATLYFSAFASASFYELITTAAAFAAMSLVTALAGGIALRFNSKLVAVLGVVGGFGTPIMLSTGVVNFPGLFGYMTILSLGVLWICSYKQWPLLHYLSWLCNWGLAVAALRAFVPSQHFREVMPFLVGFFVIYSTAVFLYNLRTRKKSNLLDVVMLFLNAGTFFMVSYRLIDLSYSREWIAAVTLGLTAFYTLHVYYCLARKTLDRELMISFLGLAAFFLTITFPLLLSDEWITVSWSVQALVLLWIGRKLNSRFLTQAAFVIYTIVAYRILILDLPHQYRIQPSTDLTWSEYGGQMLQRLVMFGVPIGSLALAFRMLKSGTTSGGLAVSSENDVPNLVEDSTLSRGIVAAAAGLLFVYLHLELNRTFGFANDAFRLPVLTLLWLALASVLLWTYRRTKNALVLAATTVVVSIVLIKLFVFDIHSWGVTNLRYRGSYSFFDASLRLLDFGVIILFLGMGLRLFTGQDQEQKQDHEQERFVGSAMGVAGLLLLFVYTSLELNTFLEAFIPGLRAGGITLLWTVFALSMIVIGLRHKSRPIRYTGLGLFGVVAWKVFFSDLASLDQIYRIVAFILMGVLVLTGSFLYLRNRESFMIDDADQSAENKSS